MRAYRAQFRDSLRPKLRRRLRRLTVATNRGRDLEVLLGWVRDRLPRLEARERTGARWLAERLEARRQEEFVRVSDEVRRDFLALAPRLRKRLSAYQQELAADGVATPTAFVAVAAGAVREAGRDLGERIASVESAGGEGGGEDAGATHRVRIAAKRLRYLLEPLASPAGGTLVRRLKTLQDVLGELNEMHLLDIEIAEAVAAGASERARRLHDLAIADEAPAVRRSAQRRRNERPGLIALAKQCAARRDQLFLTFAAEWLAGRAATFLRQVEEVAVSLEAGPATPVAPPSPVPPPPQALPRRYRRGPKPGWQAPA
jgi:CHAD domain-containing protein